MRIHHNTMKKAKLHGITLEIVENEVSARKGDHHLASHMSGSKALDMALERLAKLNIPEPAPKTSPTGRVVDNRPETQSIAPKTAEFKAIKTTTIKHMGRDETNPFAPLDNKGWMDAEEGVVEHATSTGKKFYTKKPEVDSAIQDQEEGPDDVALPDTSSGVVKRTYRDRYKPHGSTCGDDLAAQVAEHIKYEDDAGQMRVDSAKLKALAQLNDCWDAKYANLNNGLARMSVVNRLRAKVRKGHSVKWGTK